MNCADCGHDVDAHDMRALDGCAGCSHCIRAAFKPVNFTMADGERVFSGFADGTTWNGWDNVQVTPHVRAEIVEFVSDADSVCCPHPLQDHYPASNYVPGALWARCAACECIEWNDGASGIASLPVNRLGLVDLGNAYCTSLIDPHEFHGGAAGSFASEGCAECIAIEEDN